jgi:hypothetical protein
MEVKEEIYELLKIDYALCLLIANRLRTQVGTVKKWAYRGQHAKVGHYKVVKIIMEYANLTEEDYFEQELVKA